MVKNIYNFSRVNCWNVSGCFSKHSGNKRYQQNGAPIHFNTVIQNYLNETFAIVGLGVEVNILDLLALTSCGVLCVGIS